MGLFCFAETTVKINKGTYIHYIGNMLELSLFPL